MVEVLATELLLLGDMRFASLTEAADGVGAAEADDDGVLLEEMIRES